MTRVRVTAAEDVGAVIAALRELIEALDRRVPDMKRVDEVRVLGQAAMLRAEAIARIHSLSAMPHGSRE